MPWVQMEKELREYEYEIWKADKRLAVAKDDDPLKAFQEALKAAMTLDEFEIIEVTRKKVHSSGKLD